MKDNTLKVMCTFATSAAMLMSLQSTALADDTDSTSTTTGIVTADVLNVRANPNTSSGIIGSLTYNTKVTILEISHGWYRINYDGSNGWISGDYVTLSTGNAASNVGRASGAGTVTADYLNVRSGAGTGYSVIGGLSEGALVSIISSENGWYKISYDGTTGWISGDYVSVGGSSSSNESSSSNQASSSGTVTADYLNVRSGAGTGYGVIGGLSEGSSVSIISTENGWCKINYNGGTGYVSSDYISSGSSSEENSSTSSSPSESSATVTADVLNIRSGAGTGYGVIGTLTYNSSVSVISNSNGWSQISHNGTTGYVSSDYLDFSGSSSSSGSGSSSSESASNSGVVTADFLNVRSGAGTGYRVIGELSEGYRVSIISSSNGWYEINYNGTTGYVSADYINTSSTEGTVTPGYSVTGKVAIVTADALNVRSGAGTGYGIVGTTRYGSQLPVVSYASGWYQVQFGGGTGYISGDYVTIADEGSISNPLVKETPLIDCAYSGEDIAEKAKEYIGVPYVWGGFTPMGFDCSGLVQYVYRMFGISIERTTYYQVHQGQIVDRNNLRAGDLIFFTTNDEDPNDISHVGMYIGNDMFIQAPKPGDTVRISNLNSAYYTSRYYVAKRIIR